MSGVPPLVGFAVNWMLRLLEVIKVPETLPFEAKYNPITRFVGVTGLPLLSSAMNSNAVTGSNVNTVPGCTDCNCDIVLSVSEPTL